MQMLSNSNLYRSILYITCGVFALVGSLVFFSQLFGGRSSAPPSTATALAALEHDGVTTTAKPLFEVPRTGNEAISIASRTSHTALERNRESAMALAIGVEAWERGEIQQRAPVELALVFDVSGSMHGRPLEDVKTAATSLVDRLDESDRVAVIAYSSDARVVQPLVAASDEGRQQIRQAIINLKADGGTNIEAGWTLGRQALQGSEATIRRVVLLSDGQANEGITDIHILARMSSSTMEAGITTTSLGVGLDYNEDLLQRMARGGGGNYYFVYDTSPTQAFDTEFLHLTNSVSPRARMRLTTSEPVEIEEVEGFEWHRGPNGTWEIELGALSEGMRRDALVEFAARSYNRPVEIEAELIAFDSQGAEVRARSKNEIHIMATGEHRYDSQIMSRWQKIRTARALNDATKLYQSGDRHGPVELLEKTIRENEAFVDEHGVDEEIFERANDRLAQLAEDIENYDPRSSRGLYTIKGSKFNSASVAIDSQVTF